MAFDGFDSPVGWNGNQSGSVVWPENFVDVNPLGTHYELDENVFAYHTGADLNDNLTHGPDSDKLAPVYAIGNGTVTCAKALPGSWGNVAVIDHDGLFMSRYAHLDNFTLPSGELLKEGDVVQRGQQIGQIGNAFGKFPYHLHFDISYTRKLKTAPGHWPGIKLEEVITNYVEPRSIIRLFRPGNHAWPQPIEGFANSNVNFRCRPSTLSTIFKPLLQGEKVTILHELAGWKLLKLETGEFGWSDGDFIVEGEPDEGIDNPVLTVSTAVGIHASADGGEGVGWKQPVRKEIKALKPEVVKFMSNHDPGMIGTIVDDNKQHIKKVIVRAFLDWGRRTLTSDQFVEFTLNDTVRSVNQIKAQGIADGNIIIELHNEPNLTIEGLDYSWKDGRECVEFFAKALDQYKVEMPDVQYGLGGLSPGAAIGDLRKNSVDFLDEMLGHPRWHDFDVHLVHLYTSGNWEDIWWLDHCQSKTPTMEIWITESSWHTDDNTSGLAYAKKLFELLQLLDQRPTRGITFYCISASNSAYFHEAWCRSHNASHPFQNISQRGIAEEIKRLRS